MGEILSLLQNVGLVILPVIIQLVVIAVGVLACFFIKKALTKAGISVDEKVFSQIQETINTIVRFANQKFVDNYKEANGNGKLTEEQQMYVFEYVKNITKQILSSDEVTCLVKKYTDLDIALDYLIENSVYLNHSKTLTSVVDNDIPTEFDEECPVDTNKSDENEVVE